MTTTLRAEPFTYSMSRDAEGHREYKVVHHVESDTGRDGPLAVLATPGLPRPGDEWTFGGDNDLWAWCLPTASVTPVETRGKSNHWVVEQTFSSKPAAGSTSRCNDNPIEDPLLEPPRASGGGSKYSEEASTDRFGLPIINSAFEPVKGPKVEFDDNRPTVKIEMNVPTFFQVALAIAMKDTVNYAPLWGMARRCIKLGMPTWEKKYYGRCYAYYSLSLEFELNPKTFDRTLVDEGNMAIHGENRGGTWVITPVDNLGTMPDPLNPLHMVRYKDSHGENCRVILNGYGIPASQVSVIIPPHVVEPTYYIAIQSGTNKPLTDTNYWLRETGNGDEAWSDRFTYVPGSVVLHEDEFGVGTYIALTTNTHSRPPGEDWMTLASGITQRGLWRSTVPYNTGDRVLAAESTGTGTFNTVEEAGTIYVEKYDESDFLLLGIPTDL